MTRHYRLAGFAAVACASLAACAPYPVYQGAPAGYPGPAPYAYDQGGAYVQPAPYETFGFGGGYVDGGGGWRRDRDWRGGGGDNGWHGDRPRDNGGQRYGGEGFHGTDRQAPQAPPRFGGGGGGSGGSGFHGVAPASAPRPAPAPAQGGGKPSQWWKGS